MLLITRNAQDFDATSPSVRVPYALQSQQPKDRKCAASDRRLSQLVICR